jgi:hypothetical protein
VVLTGKPKKSAAPIVAIAVISAAAPCAYVRWFFPIFSPTVTTMRFHPIIVPKPSASATATFTPRGAVVIVVAMLVLSEARVTLPWKSTKAEVQRMGGKLRERLYVRNVKRK